MSQRMTDPFNAAIDVVVLQALKTLDRKVKSQTLVSAVQDGPAQSHSGRFLPKTKRRASRFHMNAIRASIRRLARDGAILCEPDNGDVWVWLPPSKGDGCNE